MSKKLCDCGICQRCKRRELTRLWNERNPEALRIIRQRAHQKRIASPEYKEKKRAEYLAHRADYLERAAQWQKDHPDKVNAKNNRWKKLHREQVNESNRKRLQNWTPERRAEKHRRNDLKKNYGVTPEWYEAKLAEQGGACAICGTTTNTAFNRRMHVDHHHGSKMVRGILCHHCNVGLERFESLPDWIERATAYLKQYT